MPDWRALVRARLADLDLDPVDELSVAEEIAQHVEDRFRYLQAQGWSEDEATGMALRELDEDGLAGLADLDHDR